MTSKINRLKNSISGDRRLVFVQKLSPVFFFPFFFFRTSLSEIDLHYIQLAGAQTELK